MHLFLTCYIETILSSALLSGTWYIQEWSEDGRAFGFLNSAVKGKKLQFTPERIFFGDSSDNSCKYQTSLSKSFNLDLIGDKGERAKGIVVLEKDSVRLVFSNKDPTMRPISEEYEKNKKGFFVLYLKRTK